MEFFILIIKVISPPLSLSVIYLSKIISSTSNVWNSEVLLRMTKKMYMVVFYLEYAFLLTLQDKSVVWILFSSFWVFYCKTAGASANNWLEFVFSLVVYHPWN